MSGRKRARRLAAACFPPRRDAILFARLYAGRPYRTSKTRNLIKNNHRCAPPSALKDVQCRVKSGKTTKVVTYSKLCTGYATLVEPVGVKGSKTNAEAKKNSVKLAARTTYETALAKHGGILLEHSVAGFQFRKMYCKPKKTMYEITETDRKKTCLSLLLDSGLGDSFVYEQDRSRHRGLGKRQSSFDWPDEEITVKEVCLRGAMNTCKPPENDGKCLEGQQDYKLSIADCGKLSGKGPVTAAGFDQAASITCSNKMLSISFSPVIRSLVACHHTASLVKITSDWAAVAKGLAEQYLSLNEPADADETAINNLRTSLTDLALKENGIPHALRPFAWAFLAHRPANPSWQTDLGFNPDKIALRAYYEKVVSAGLTKWNTICQKYATEAKDDYAPCMGFVQMAKDVSRLGTELLGVTLQLQNLHSLLPVEQGKKYPTLTKELMDSYIKSAPKDQSKRVAFYLNMHIATEELFQIYHGNGPMYRGEINSEFFQNRAFYPIFFLASILPPETAFLVRSYMLAEAEPFTAQAKHWALFEECANFETAMFDKSKLSSKHEDVYNSRIFDRVKDFVGRLQPTTNMFFIAAKGSAEKEDGTLDSRDPAGGFDRAGTTCKSRDMLLTDLLWRSRDAEPAYRIADLQLLLPRDQARRVVDAAFRAFAVMYEGRLRALEDEGPAAVIESISCSVRAIANNENYKNSKQTVSDLYSPPFTETDQWFRFVLATAKGESIPDVLKAALTANTAALAP